MGTNPLVSIIIPTYNRAQYLGETIKSVQVQTYANWELIIVDDGSIDLTASLVREHNDNRLRYYYIDHSGLIGKVRNIGMRLIKGDMVSFLDSDDLWQPDKLELQIKILNENPQAAFAFSHAEQFGLGSILAPTLENFFYGNVFHAHLLEERFVLYPSTFIFKSSLLTTMDWFDESFSAGESDFFLRMAHKYPGVFIGDKLVKLRKHSQNISKERDLLFTRDNLRMLKKFFLEKYITEREYIQLASKQHYKQGLLCLRRGKPTDALESFLKHTSLKPFNYKGWIRIFHAWLLSFRSNALNI
jgi:glycosyltransferase involved in cell wall biosynthesis